MKNKELFIGAIALIFILFLYNYLQQTDSSNNNGNNNGKKNIGEFPVPQTTSITQKLSNGLKNFPKNCFHQKNTKLKDFLYYHKNDVEHLLLQNRFGPL